MKYSGGGSRLFLIVSVARSFGSGNFFSTKNNYLLCGYEIRENIANLTTLLSNLYRNVGRCSYTGSPALLNMTLGKSNFRTLNFSKIGQLVSYDIPIDGAIQEEDDELS